MGTDTENAIEQESSDLQNVEITHLREEFTIPIPNREIARMSAGTDRGQMSLPTIDLSVKSVKSVVQFPWLRLAALGHLRANAFSSSGRRPEKGAGAERGIFAKRTQTHLLQ